jgi:hypothetical protein
MSSNGIVKPKRMSWMVMWLAQNVIGEPEGKRLLG